MYAAAAELTVLHPSSVRRLCFAWPTRFLVACSDVAASAAAAQARGVNDRSHGGGQPNGMDVDDQQLQQQHAAALGEAAAGSSDSWLGLAKANQHELCALLLPKLRAQQQQPLPMAVPAERLPAAAATAAPAPQPAPTGQEERLGAAAHSNASQGPSASAAAAFEPSALRVSQRQSPQGGVADVPASRWGSEANISKASLVNVGTLGEDSEDSEGPLPDIDSGPSSDEEG